MTSPHRSERALSMILCSSFVNRGSSVVSEEALKLEPLRARVKLEVTRSSAKGGVSSVVVVVEELSGMVTLADEEVLSPKVEKRRPTVLVLLAEVASVVEAKLSLKKPGASVVKLLQVELICGKMVELLQVELIGGAMVELLQVELTCVAMVVVDAESPGAEKVTKASVRLTFKSGKSRFGAEPLMEAGEEEGEVELVSILKRSHESSSPRRVLQAGLSGRPSILLMERLIGP